MTGFSRPEYQSATAGEIRQASVPDESIRGILERLHGRVNKLTELAGMIEANVEAIGGNFTGPTSSVLVGPSGGAPVLPEKASHAIFMAHGLEHRLDTLLTRLEQIHNRLGVIA